MTAEERARRVKLIVCDVDGTLTDGRIYIGADGEAFKAFSGKDGMGITLWQRVGGEVAIITGRQSAIVERRCAELKIAHCYQGRFDKRDAYDDLKAKLALADEDIAYIGDDWNDWPLLRQVGFAATVAGADPELARLAHFNAKHRGGDGAVREVIEFILKAQGRWDDALSVWDE